MSSSWNQKRMLQSRQWFLARSSLVHWGTFDNVRLSHQDHVHSQHSAGRCWYILPRTVQAAYRDPVSLILSTVQKLRYPDSGSVSTKPQPTMHEQQASLSFHHMLSQKSMLIGKMQTTGLNSSNTESELCGTVAIILPQKASAKRLYIVLQSLSPAPFSSRKEIFLPGFSSQLIIYDLSPMLGKGGNLFN